MGGRRLGMRSTWRVCLGVLLLLLDLSSLLLFAKIALGGWKVGFGLGYIFRGYAMDGWGCMGFGGVVYTYCREGR
jgi:hypothetical protein